MDKHGGTGRHAGQGHESDMTSVNLRMEFPKFGHTLDPTLAPGLLPQSHDSLAPCISKGSSESQSI